MASGSSSLFRQLYTLREGNTRRTLCAQQRTAVEKESIDGCSEGVTLSFEAIKNPLSTVEGASLTVDEREAWSDQWPFGSVFSRHRQRHKEQERFKTQAGDSFGGFIREAA